MGQGNRHPVKEWKSGQSGNPNGRPKKGNTWRALLNEIGESQQVKVTLIDSNGNKKDVEINVPEGNIKQAIANLAYVQAFKGNHQALNLIIENTDGITREIKEIDINKLSREDLETLAKIQDKLIEDKREEKKHENNKEEGKMNRLEEKEK